MSISFNLLRGFNLYTGDRPADSQHLKIETLKLPELEEDTQSFKAGGSDFEREIAVGIKALSLSFKLKAYEPDVMQHFAVGWADKKRYTAYGSITDEVTGQESDIVVQFVGRVTKVAPDELKRGEQLGHEYEVKDITFYSFKQGDKILHEFDWATNTKIVAGVNQNATINRHLRIG